MILIRKFERKDFYYNSVTLETLLQDEPWGRDVQDGRGPAWPSGQDALRPLGAATAARGSRLRMLPLETFGPWCKQLMHNVGSRRGLVKGIARAPPERGRGLASGQEPLKRPGCTEEGL